MERIPQHIHTSAGDTLASKIFSGRPAPGLRNAMGPSPSMHQKGATHLLVVLVLLSASTILVLSVARTGVLDARMSSNEYQLTILRLATETGLETGIAWLGRNLPNWEKGLDPQGRQTAPLPESAYAPKSQTDSRYTLEIELHRKDPYSPYIEITSTATNIADRNSSLSVRQHVVPNGGPIHPGIDLPPLVIGGCLGKSSSRASIYARDWNNHGSAGPAIQTKTSRAADCVDTATLSLHEDAVQYETFPNSAWNYVFRKSKDEIRALAEQESSAGIPNIARTFIWETHPKDYHRSWGSPTHPVVLIFTATAECPRFIGRFTVYGIVYIDGNCQSFGGLDLYGSVVIEGEVSGIGPGTTLHHFSEISGGPLRFVPDGIATVPGTWHDF